LAQALEAILARQDFSCRLEKTGDPEQDKIAGLINKLLVEIQGRDEKLLQNKKALKARIAAHTENLKKKNGELELALREAQTAGQSKSVFLANMSHELRTPLNAIIGYSEMLSEDAADEGYEALLPDLQKIHEAGKNLFGWVNEIVDLAKIESGRAELQIESVAVADLLQEVETAVRPALQRSGNRLRVRRPENIGSMMGDGRRIRRVLERLLDHADRATKQGTVSLEARRETVDGVDWIGFAVSDSGAGIDPKLLQNLFKDYTRADPAVSSAYGGVALGLAICHRFGLLMGGNISADSELGRGSTFTLRLPADMKTHLAKSHVIRGTNRLLSDILNLQ